VLQRLGVHGVLIDSNAVAPLARDPTLRGRLGPSDRPVVSYVTGPELRGAVAPPGTNGMRGVPRHLGLLSVLEQRPSIDGIISFRGGLTRLRGRFGDGIIGAQALELRLPLVTDDGELARAVRAAGGEVRFVRS
jgi:predicted nucleic acid-binding protein